MLELGVIVSVVVFVLVMRSRKKREPTLSDHLMAGVLDRHKPERSGVVMQDAHRDPWLG